MYPFGFEVLCLVGQGTPEACSSKTNVSCIPEYGVLGGATLLFIVQLFQRVKQLLFL